MIDFLCIGAQKAGTTWLMTNLGGHPEVWTPPFVKELHYFDTVHLGFGKSWVLETYQKKGTGLFGENSPLRPYFEKVIDPKLAFTDEWYEHVFSIAPRNARRGECTPLYCALNEQGIAHVAQLAPAVRLIYIIRNPQDRMLSSCRMIMTRRSFNNEKGCHALLDNELFIKRGDYLENIPRWERRFREDQILYIPFGDIKNHPADVMRRVEQHLGLTSFDGYPRLFDSVHRTKVQDVLFSPDFLGRIRGICQPQDAFLRERFGERFLTLTK